MFRVDQNMRITSHDIKEAVFQDALLNQEAQMEDLADPV